MINEYDELVERLKNLIALCKKKKFQLAKPEKDETINVLSNLIVFDVNGFNIIMSSLFELPSVIGADLLSDHWFNLNESHDLIFAKLREDQYSSDLGKRLRLLLAQKLIEKDAKASVRILVDVFLSMKPSKQYFPNSDDLKLIYSSVLKKGAESVSILPLHECSKSHLTLILYYLLGAAFFAKEKKQLVVSFETQAILLKWVNKFAEIDKLPSELHNAITYASRNWDNKQKEMMRLELNNLKPVFKQILEPTLIVTTVNEEKEHSISTSLSLETKTQDSSPDIEIKSSDILDDIERFSNRVRCLVEELKHLKSDLQIKQSRLESLQREEANNKKTIELERENIRKLSSQNLELAEEKKKLEESTSKIQDQLHEMKSKCETMSDELDNATERIKKESDHKISAFCANLSAKLRDNFINLKDSEDMDMTLELGIALRTHLKQMIMILEKEGIHFNART